MLLELVLGRCRSAAGGQDSLHQAKARILDFFQLFVLGLVSFLVGLLQSFHEHLEVFLDLLLFSFLVRNSLFEVVLAHRLELFNFLLLVGVAQVNVLGTAHGLEFFFREFLERIEITAALIVLQVSRVAPL
jgi:hypothetical protein